MVMDTSAKPVYRFGPFRYDCGQHILFRQDEMVPLAPKVADTLGVLLDNPGSLVDKAELMRRVWPDTTVEEIGLARNISQLRKALGGENESAAYIETIPKRGYRFVAAVATEAPESQGQPQARRKRSFFSRHRRFLLVVPAVAALLAILYWQFYRPSRYLLSGNDVANIAVVPFECLSPELNCYTYPRGLNDLIVARLSHIDRVQALSPSTVTSYQRAHLSMAFMGRLLGMDVRLEGTVQLMGDRVRITARLVDAYSAKLVWSDSYEYPADRLADAQNQAAREIAAQVGAHLAIHKQFPSRNQ